MKMSYLHTNYNFSQRKEASWKKITLIVVSVLVIYLWGSAMFVEVSSFVVYPLLKISGQIDQNFSDSLQTTKSLLSENKKLRSENESLQAKVLSLKNLQTENNQLRGLKENVLSSSDSYIIGQVIAKPKYLPYDEIIIDLGKDRVPDLSNGKLVFADKDVILGQIELVSDKYSKIKLYSTGGVKIPVLVGEEAIPSIAEGLGAGNFSLSLPRGVDIKVGDKVKTSIVGSYTLGYVAKVIKEPNDPFQKIIFRSPFNVFEIGWVQLLK
jgi:rod shape-determining protein MreC